MRKILHLENKTTNKHRYYGSLVALCRANESIIPKAFYHTLKRLKFETPYETETYIIRLGSLQTPSDVEAVKEISSASLISVETEEAEAQNIIVTEAIKAIKKIDL